VGIARQAANLRDEIRGGRVRVQECLKFLSALLHAFRVINRIDKQKLSNQVTPSCDGLFQSYPESVRAHDCTGGSGSGIHATAGHVYSLSFQFML
jgi:hypothetical protein